MAAGQQAINAQRSWYACLQLQADYSRDRTRLKRIRHLGPLRIQRPFYPESNGCCHVYVLHPPGGLVNGDEIAIEIKTEANAHILVTTPSAGKAYNSLSPDLKQRQSLNVELAEGSTLEWLPQETIVFQGAQFISDINIELAASASLACWEFICLGRPASAEDFRQGQVQQRIKITRSGKPLLYERSCIDGDSAIMDRDWGLAGNRCMGTFIISLVMSDAELQTLRETSSVNEGELYFTRRGELLIVRYLGAQAEAGKLAFEAIWQQLRERYNAGPAVRPRIWNT